MLAKLSQIQLQLFIDHHQNSHKQKNDTRRYRFKKIKIFLLQRIHL